MCCYANFGSTIVIYEVTTYACIRKSSILSSAGRAFLYQQEDLRRVKERFDRGLVLQLTRPLIDVSPVLVAQTVILLSRERGEAGAEVLIMRNRGAR